MVFFVWLCIRPGIQKQGTECRKCGNGENIINDTSIIEPKYCLRNERNELHQVIKIVFFLSTISGNKNIKNMFKAWKKSTKKKTCCFLLLRSVTFTEAVTEVFYLKAVLKNSAIFTGQQLCWSLFLIKYQARSPATILKRLQHRCFPVNIATFLIKRIWVGSTNSCSIKIFSE